MCLFFSWKSPLHKNCPTQAPSWPRPILQQHGMVDWVRKKAKFETKTTKMGHMFMVTAWGQWLTALCVRSCQSRVQKQSCQAKISSLEFRLSTDFDRLSSVVTPVSWAGFTVYDTHVRSEVTVVVHVAQEWIIWPEDLSKPMAVIHECISWCWPLNGCRLLHLRQLSTFIKSRNKHASWVIAWGKSRVHRLQDAD